MNKLVETSLVSTLDEIDMKILSALIDNSRESLVSIGEKVGLSRVAVKSRIDSLEQRGIIEQYTIIINPEKLGHMITMNLNLSVRPEHLNEVLERLKNEDSIIKLYQMTGESSLHIHGLFRDSAHVDDFLSNVIYKLPGIVHVDCNTILSRIKDNIELRL